MSQAAEEDKQTQCTKCGSSKVSEISVDGLAVTKDGSPLFPYEVHQVGCIISKVRLNYICDDCDNTYVERPTGKD